MACVIEAAVGRLQEVLAASERKRRQMHAHLARGHVEHFLELPISRDLAFLDFEQRGEVAGEGRGRCVLDLEAADFVFPTAAGRRGRRCGD